MRLQAGDRVDIRWKRARVWLDGQDVTNDCFMADDERGEVGLFVRDHSGRTMSDDYGEPVEEFRSGVVRIELASEIP